MAAARRAAGFTAAAGFPAVAAAIAARVLAQEAVSRAQGAITIPIVLAELVSFIMPAHPYGKV